MTGPDLVLTMGQRDQIIADALARLPAEACGLVAGRNGEAARVYPVTNILNSPVRFMMDPQEQIDLLLQFDRQGWDLLAIYHSHPYGPERPSATDVAECGFPEAVQLIVSPDQKGFQIRGFFIRDSRITNATLQILDG